MEISCMEREILIVDRAIKYKWLLQNRFEILKSMYDFKCLLNQLSETNYFKILHKMNMDAYCRPLILTHRSLAQFRGSV